MRRVRLAVCVQGAGQLVANIGTAESLTSALAAELLDLRLLGQDELSGLGSPYLSLEGGLEELGELRSIGSRRLVSSTARAVSSRVTAARKPFGLEAAAKA